jgi:hypothetical protein
MARSIINSSKALIIKSSLDIIMALRVNTTPEPHHAPMSLNDATPCITDVKQQGA